jgi:hypothetical protein
LRLFGGSSGKLDDPSAVFDITNSWLLTTLNYLR